MKYPIGTMSAGDILGRGFSLLFSRFAIFYAIMLIVTLPVLAVQLALPDLMAGGLGNLVLIIPNLVLQTIGTGAMIRVVMQEYLDRPVTFGEAFQFALSRFGGLLGTSLLVGIFVFLGLLACIIPGIYLGVIFSLASQAVIVEERSGMDALNRSKSLIEGYFGRVFGILFLIGIMGAVAGIAIGTVGATVLPFQEVVRTAGPLPTVRVGNYVNYAIIESLTTLVQTFFQAYTAICSTLLYFDLRNRKENFDLELEADKISAWTEHFHSQSQPANRDIQPADTGIQPTLDVEPPSAGIRPIPPEAPPHR